jgi:hypothetical protein
MSNMQPAGSAQERSDAGKGVDTDRTKTGRESEERGVVQAYGLISL